MMHRLKLRLRILDKYNMHHICPLLICGATFRSNSRIDFHSVAKDKCITHSWIHCNILLFMAIKYMYDVACIFDVLIYPVAEIISQ